LTDLDRRRATVDVWVRRGCAVVVALVAAYASYEHQRVFALRGGADPTQRGPVAAVGGWTVAAGVDRAHPRFRPESAAAVCGLGGVRVGHRGVAGRQHRIGSGTGLAAHFGGRLATGLLATRSGVGEPSFDTPRPRAESREWCRDKARAAHRPGRGRDVGLFPVGTLPGTHADRCGTGSNSRDKQLRARRRTQMAPGRPTQARCGATRRCKLTRCSTDRSGQSR